MNRKVLLFVGSLVCSMSLAFAQQSPGTKGVDDLDQVLSSLSAQEK